MASVHSKSPNLKFGSSLYDDQKPHLVEVISPRPLRAATDSPTSLAAKMESRFNDESAEVVDSVLQARERGYRAPEEIPIKKRACMGMGDISNLISFISMVACILVFYLVPRDLQEDGTWQRQLVLYMLSFTLYRSVNLFLSDRIVAYHATPCPPRAPPSLPTPHTSFSFRLVASLEARPTGWP